MAEVKQTSGLFKINWQDAGKGLIVAVIGAVLNVVVESVNNGQISFNWKQIGSVALLAGASYLLKNFFTPTQTVVKEEK